jgi:hypothetical protein
MSFSLERSHASTSDEGIDQRASFMQPNYMQRLQLDRNPEKDSGDVQTVVDKSSRLVYRVDVFRDQIQDHRESLVVEGMGVHYEETCSGTTSEPSLCRQRHGDDCELDHAQY